MNQKLLIIDDDEGDQKLVQEAVKSAGLGFDIFTAANGEDGVKKIEELKSHVVVVLDTLLPGMDGFQTCKKIRDMERTDVKIIICTGMIDAVDAVKAKEMGADDYCAKSPDCEDLLNAIKSLQ